MQILAQGPHGGPPTTAPTFLSAIPTNTNVAISFTAPTNDGGLTITNYEYSFNNSTWTALSPADATSPITVSGLTQNTAYTVYLRAVNVAGSGPGSTGVSFTTAGVPTGTPTITSVTVGNTTATVNYTYPGGGGAATGYDLYVANQTNAWNNTTASPISVTGLSAGTTYTFYVRAKNAYGTGPQSAGVSATTNQLTVQYFVLGGGGGGSSAGSWNGSPFVGSGGGGGGIRTSYGSVNGGGNAMSAALNGLAGTTQTVTVGGGGGGGVAAGWSPGNSGGAGGSSQFASVVSTGGGAGIIGGPGAASGSLGYQSNASNQYWAIGGSAAAGSAGGNASRPGTPYGGIHGTAGNGITTTITGGGAARGGAGGNGAVQNSNGGINVEYSAGGGGGGGRGGGYGNNMPAAAGIAGTANCGAGGGSGAWHQYGGQGTGGAGGSGYVAIRYPNSYGTLVSVGGGLAWSTSVDGSDRVYQFTGGTGSIVFPSY
jgi:hypothetical protein